MTTNRFDVSHITRYVGGTIVCEEHYKKILFDCNGETFHKVIIDGGVVSNNTNELRCDFMIIQDDESIELYIELKGQDIAHAAKQILQTIKNHGSQRAKKRYTAIVTSSTTAPRKNTALDNAKMLLRKETSITPFIKNNILRLKYDLGEVTKTN